MIYLALNNCIYNMLLYYPFRNVNLFEICITHFFFIPSLSITFPILSIFFLFFYILPYQHFISPFTPFLLTGTPSLSPSSFLAHSLSLSLSPTLTHPTLIQLEILNSDWYQVKEFSVLHFLALFIDIRENEVRCNTASLQMLLFIGAKWKFARLALEKPIRWNQATWRWCFLMWAHSLY